MDTDIAYHKSSDSDLAAAIVTMGIPIDGIDAPPGSYQYDFYIRQSPENTQAIQDFYDRKLRLEPMALFASRKEIIQRIKDEQRKEESLKELH